MKKSETKIASDNNKMGEKVKLISFDRSVPNQIFSYLREEIVSMDLQPGEMISESSLAEKFGVSRTPVREAILKLANLGFVEVRPQRGTFVSQLGMAKILEARFVREALEVAVASSLAEKPDPQTVARCEEIIREQEKAAETHDPLLFQELDDQFHQELANATGYARVAFLIEGEKSHMDRVRNLSLQELGGQYEKVLAQHSAILNAIKDADPIKAKRAMETHMKDVFNILKVAPINHPEYFSES